MIDSNSKHTPKKRSTSRKPRRRILVNDVHNAPSPTPASDLDTQGSMPPTQSISGRSDLHPSSAVDQPDDTPDIGLPDDHPAVRAFYDGADEDEHVGYKNTPKKTRYKKGQSGNPSGKRKVPIMPPGTVNSLIGKTILEAISDLMGSSVSDLPVLEDDNVATALAKRLVTDALKNEGRSRTLLIDYYVEPQRTAERYQQPDHRATEAQMLGEMARVLIDPTITDEELAEKMERWVRTKDEIAIFKDGPLDELPQLPRPKKPRKTRKGSGRATPRRSTKTITQEPTGPKN